MLKNQAFARAVSEWVLEGCVSMPVAALLAGVITSGLPVTRQVQSLTLFFAKRRA
jgi:flagellar biosynthesis protein FliQ